MPGGNWFPLQDISDGERFFSGSKLENPIRTCKIWDPANAKFQICALNYISAIPALILLIYLVILCIKFLTRGILPPTWAKNFIQEDEEISKKLTPISRRLVTALLLLSLGGFTAQTTSTFYPTIRIMMIPSTLAWAFAILLIIISHRKTASFGLLTIFISLSITQIIILLENDEFYQRGVSLTLSAIFSSAAIITILQMPIRKPGQYSNQIGISPAFSTPSADFRSPEDNLTVWQFMSISWMEPLISLGKSRQLNDEDVWSLGYEFKHHLLFKKFRGLKGSVLSKIIKANCLDLCIVSALGMLELIANLISPVLLQKILQSIENPLTPEKVTLIYAILMLLVQWIASQSSVFSLWYGRRVYERSRGELITMLYEKVLSRKVSAKSNIVNLKPNLDDFHNRRYRPKCLDKTIFKYLYKSCIKPIQRFCNYFKPSSKHDNASTDLASTGRVINLMRFDVYEVAQRFWEFSNIITQPFSLIFSIILIWRLLGWSSLLGITIVLLAQILNTMLAQVLTRWERYRKLATDVKLQRISQFVEAIRHLRYYAWQEFWLKGIMEARQHELGLRIITSIWTVFINFINILASGLLPVVAFWAYTVLSGKSLTVDVAFPALQIFSILEKSLRELPNLTTALLNARVSLERLDTFMMEPDVLDIEIAPSSSEIKLKNASFAWPGTKKPILHDLNLAFQPGLTVISGEVGAGKSALLLALLGELDQLGGEALRKTEKIGYCGQMPWLQSMSIRENILFFAPYEEIRYWKVLEACALIPDLANFQHGDLSMVGENGVGLSGGQKSRVSLARAVYSDANILLLDDPLSSLDHETADYVVQKCLAGPLLRGRIVILVTHRPEICSHISKQTILVANGRAFVIDLEEISVNTPREIEEKDTSNHNNCRIPKDGLSLSPADFIESEYRAHGGVKGKVYWEYIKAGKLNWWFILICILALYRFIEIGKTWFLQQWGEAYGKLRQQKVIENPVRGLPPPEMNIRPWLMGFFILVISQALAYLISQGVMVRIIYKAGKILFAKVMVNVTYVNFRFYDITPVGRLMNRLTSDINTVDGNISNQFHDVTILSITWIFSLITIGSVTPIFLFFAVSLSVCFLVIFLRFLPTSQSLRRLEMVSLTPLISNFGAVTDGLTTIRAYCVSSRFQNRVIAVTDNFQKMDHFYWSLQAWLMYRLDTLSAISTFILTILALYTGISAGLVAFVLTASSRFVMATHTLCRKYGQLQMDFVSVERVVELLHIPQEQKGTVIPPASWPRFGSDIIFENVSIKYAPHLERALSNISLTIRGGSITAITGRTGSGKSSLALSLLAIIHPTDGRIIVDGLDLATIDAQVLRSRIFFLAQDPVLFPGTLHENLDPLRQYSVLECEAVITAVAGGRHDWSLQTQIDPGGRNMSQGQRQLIGLARSFLRRSPILVLDEVTASIDGDTAGRVYTLLREWMSESTIITVAHRKEAIRGADTTVVMKDGKIADVKRMELRN